jgi:hypothetical protein
MLPLIRMEPQKIWRRIVNASLKRWSRIGLLAFSLAAFLCLPSDVPASLAFRTYNVVREDLFVPLHWMVRALLELPSGTRDTANDVQTVRRAFELRAEALRLERELNRRYAATAFIDPALARGVVQAEAEADSLEGALVNVISRQVESELGSEGLSLAPWSFFPPVNFRYSQLPNVLILSPRDRVYRTLAITLNGDLTILETEDIEERVAKLGFSALVVPIGGLGTYPSMLPRSNDLPGTLQTVAHEWAHHYFFFRPLGWRYGLGLEIDGDVIAINETAANYVGKEIGRRVNARYYGGPPPEAAEQEKEDSPEDRQQDEFSRLMRETRQAVDTLLAAGRVDDAEQYMEKQRFYLADRGYRIRKLNQAYFAFYGSYADSPGFISPIGENIRRIRVASPTLRDFVEKMSGLSSVADLQRALGDIP